TVYFYWTQFQKALADFDAALKIDPQSFEARLWRGDTYNQLGQPKKARTDFAQLGKSKPEKPDGYVRRAIVYLSDGNAYGAIADLTKAMELDKALVPVAYPLRASGYMKKENFQAALD